VIGVINSSIISIRQMDLKRIIAYASVAHMNLVILGTFAPANINGFDGALYLMIAHGVVSAGLFFGIGFIYDRTYSRII
jgi:NADH:ubiquinone oxidoreductase subunit 4 (subunit M)